MKFGSGLACDQLGMILSLRASSFFRSATVRYQLVRAASKTSRERIEAGTVERDLAKMTEVFSFPSWKRQGTAETG